MLLENDLRCLEALSFRYMEKRRNTSTESSLLLMCSYKYLNCLKNIKSNFSVFLIKFFSFKDISCSMNLIVY